MDTPIPSYADKVYTVIDNLAVVRDAKNLSRSSLYKRGERRPPGKKVGDRKIIPMMTQVRVTGVRTTEDRNVYVFAEATDRDSAAPAGWTRVTNLEGAFLNELVGYVPDEWDLEPQGRNFTVTDARALIRQGSPPYRSLGSVIAPGTYVVVTARSKDTDPPGKHVRVSRGKIADGKIAAVDPIGWTAASNLSPGCSPRFTESDWTSDQGPNACWRRGKYIGPQVLVNIVGTGGQMEQITFAMLEAFTKLRQAAAKKNLHIGINSGFRTFAQQKKLFDAWKARRGNKAATPGRSNHQHGQALDLNTGGFDGSPVYDWMKKNGPRFGFVRTVNKEHWHWEHRPEEAAELAEKGRFKRAGVTV